MKQHVCVIVSRRRDTSFEASFRHRKNHLADVLSFDACNTVCIHSKILFQIIFKEKKNSYFFFNLENLKLIKYHVSVILSWRRETLYNSLILSCLCDSITQNSDLPLTAWALLS